MDRANPCAARRTARPASVARSDVRAALKGLALISLQTASNSASSHSFENAFQRNAAYDTAIRRAVEFKRALGCKDLLALDIGAGTGLLSMMAVRYLLSWQQSWPVTSSVIIRYQSKVGTECHR
jgi:hypothetical protein